MFEGGEVYRPERTLLARSGRALADAAGRGRPHARARWVAASTTGCRTRRRPTTRRGRPRQPPAPRRRRRGRRGAAGGARRSSVDAGGAHEPATARPTRSWYARLRGQVADRLNQQRRSDEVLGRTPMSAEDERQFARSLIVQVLEDHARGEITDGRTPPTAEEEELVASAVHAALFGVGRLQPLLENPEVENIDINGCDRVFVSYADGREELVRPGRRQRRGAGRAHPDPGRQRRAGVAALRLGQPAARPAAARRLAALGRDGGLLPPERLDPALPARQGQPRRPGRQRHR